LQKDSYDIAHSTEDLRQLILEELNKIGAWSFLSFNANNDFKETSPSRTNYEGYVLLSSCQDYEGVKTPGDETEKYVGVESTSKICGIDFGITRS
jgi:hypothetical protein